MRVVHGFAVGGRGERRADGGGKKGRRKGRREMKYRRKKIGYRDRERETRRKESERERYSNSRAYGSLLSGTVNWANLFLEAFSRKGILRQAIPLAFLSSYAVAYISICCHPAYDATHSAGYRVDRKKKRFAQKPLCPSSCITEIASKHHESV